MQAIMKNTHIKKNTDKELLVVKKDLFEDNGVVLLQNGKTIKKLESSR